jgi:hypothetical protein
MPGHRLGNGTEADALHLAEPAGLPPSWSPFNPWHYLTFGYWACTFSYSNLNLSHKYVQLRFKVLRRALCIVFLIFPHLTLHFDLIILGFDEKSPL